MNPPYDKNINLNGKRSYYFFIIINIILFSIILSQLVFDTSPMTGLRVDMVDNHIPLINWFIKNGSNIFASPEYLAAYIPGYHMMMGIFGHIIGASSVNDNVTIFRLFNFLFGIVFISIWLIIILSRNINLYVATILELLLLSSVYIEQSMIILSTDIFGSLALILMIFELLKKGANVFKCCAISIAAVFWRDNYIVISIAPLLIFAFRNDFRRMKYYAASMLLPFALMGVFVLKWGAMVPHGINTEHGIVLSTSGTLHILAYLGILGAAFGLWLAEDYRRIFRSRLGLRIFSGLMIAFTFAWLIGPSTMNPDAGRWASFVWAATKYFPSYGEHSSFIFIMGSIGILFSSVAIQRMIDQKELFPELVVAALYLGAIALQLQSWLRFIEPTVLIAVTIFITRIPKPRLIKVAPVAIFAVAYFTVMLIRGFGLSAGLTHVAG